MAARNALLKHLRVNVRSLHQNPSFVSSSQSFGNVLRRHFSDEVKGSFLDKAEVTERVIVAVKNFQKVDPAKSKNILDASFEKLPCHGLGKELTGFWGKSLGYRLISRGYLTEANRDGYKFVSDSSKGVQFQPVLNDMSGGEDQRITSGEVGQLNGLAPLENEGLSEGQLYKKRFRERMKIAMPVGLAPIAICNIDGANQVNAMSALDISVQSSALLLNMALFWHVKEGMKEILADYVHQEITREWISILLRLFLLIVVKDLFFLL